MTAEITKGKVVFKQKAFSLEKNSETLQELVSARSFFEDRIASGASPLSALPDAQKPLIAKLAHESDKTLAVLVKHIALELNPEPDDDVDPPVTAKAVEDTVTCLLKRVNYGLEGAPGVKPPAGICIWRWEVRDEFRDFLPKNAREKAETRRQERLQAKSRLQVLFEGLPQDEKDALLNIKLGQQLSTLNVSTNSVISDHDANTQKPDSSSPKKSQKGMESEGENDSLIVVAGDRPRPLKKTNDPAKITKEKERADKKAAKAEKAKKAHESQTKSQNMMANFFGKQGASSANRPPLNSDAPQLSEFDRTFKPFAIRKNTEMAAINWFKLNRHSTFHEDSNVIVLDDDGDVRERDSPSVDVNELSDKDRLDKIISQFPHTRRSNYRGHNPTLKTVSPVSVKDTFTRLSEAEVSGDISLVRSLQGLFQDRNYVQAKVLIFHDDARPGYFGTWTRCSRIIGPRTPLAKDVLEFDYGYDSGEDWEEEPSGEGDDVADDDDEEDVGDAEDVDSDMDSWLVDDDDEEPATPISTRSLSPMVMDILPLPTLQKRKAPSTGRDKKTSKKRKVVVALIAFSKGPCYESAIGDVLYEPFRPYQMHVFNDAPYPIDPFKDVPTPATVPPSDGDPELTKDDGFVVPLLPQRLVNVEQSVSSASSPETAAKTSGPQTKKLQPAPKTAFPNDHLPYLITTITRLRAASLTSIVEVVYQELKASKVKKNSIEAKIKEIGEKCKISKVWILKQRP